MKEKSEVYQLTLIALMAAVTSILAPFSIPIPISESPISLGIFAVYLCSLLLGPKLGTVSVLIYLLLGLVGVPVFTGWTGGIGKLFGPTGGYLIGYIFITLIGGWFAKRFAKKTILQVLGLILGTAVCYILGTVWMSYSLHMPIGAAISAAVIPFIPLDTLKIAAAIAIAYPLKKRLNILL